MNVRSRFIQGLVVSLTATSLLGSQVVLPAAGSVSSARAVDVALSVDGTLSGVVIDTKNQPRGETTVEVRRGRRVVARTRTDSRGRYSVANLPGGLYQVRVDGTETLIRAWAAGTAPRSATGPLQVVADAPIARGQDKEAPPTDAVESSSNGLFGGSSMSTGLTTALIVGGVVGAIFIIDELDDDAEDAAPASP